jgi:hypothetical protein
MYSYRSQGTLVLSMVRHRSPAPGSRVGAVMHAAMAKFSIPCRITEKYPERLKPSTRSTGVVAMCRLGGVGYQSHLIRSSDTDSGASFVGANYQTHLVRCRSLPMSHGVARAVVPEHRSAQRATTQSGAFSVRHFRLSPPQYPQSFSLVPAHPFPVPLLSSSPAALGSHRVAQATTRSL